uniref:ATP-binding cassette domain-containing protein n=1 Tax=Bradyrhizobium liaoningense TaxID=43992 RepID=UPI000550645A
MAEHHASMLSLRGLTRRFGGLTAVDTIDLDLAKGELISIIGPNGAGKTTLFNLVTGLDRPDGGAVRFEGQDITGLSPERLAAEGIARTFQLGRVFGNLSVMDNVLIGAHTRLRAVKPAVPVIGPLLELGLALLRPASVKAEEERLREEVKAILARFGERLG